MLADDERVTWLASYPKSGNTWVRCLLQAYRCNGYLDINDMHTGVGDASACYTRAVSPLPLKDLGQRGQWLLRPAALLNGMMSIAKPRIFKSHTANINVPGLPAFIPFELTHRAIYVIRDPRSVALSVSAFFQLSMPKTVEQMNSNEFWIGDSPTQDGMVQIPQLVTSWSNHVRSWCGEQRYPVHVVKYEDLLEDPLKELQEVVEFMGLEFDEARGKRAVNAAKLSKLRKAENEVGFSEYRLKPERGSFFNAGGTRWQQELGPKFIAQIEKEHRTVMKQLEYL